MKALGPKPQTEIDDSIASPKTVVEQNVNHAGPINLKTRAEGGEILLRRSLARRCGDRSRKSQLLISIWRRVPIRRRQQTLGRPFSS